MEVDHFISKKKWKEWKLEESPLAGTLDNTENLFLSCRECNRKKRDKCPEDFIGNSFKAWDRYTRANQRIGECLELNPKGSHF